MQETPFDRLAGNYDATFTGTAVGITLRRIVWSRLEQVFAGSRRVLELGCGTGEDALELARWGIEVVATDASAGMLAVAAQKAARLGHAGRVRFRCLPMEALDAELDTTRFDGVLSNFGAINCVEDLPALVSAVAARLEPGARLLWVVMGRRVPCEWIWFLGRGDWQSAWRRLRRGGTEWRGLKIFYPPPAELRARLAPYFSIESVAGLGVVLPPTYAAGWLERSPRALAVLTRLEAVARRFPALAAWSDHYIIEGTRLPVLARG